jgi:hypothetical protein
MPLQVFGHSVYPSSTLATTPTINSSYTTPIPLVSTQGGRRHASELTTVRQDICIYRPLHREGR